MSISEVESNKSKMNRNGGDDIAVALNFCGWGLKGGGQTTFLPVVKIKRDCTMRMCVKK